MTDRLTTERLILRRWTDDDREPFADLNADPEVMRYFPKTLTKVESDTLVDRIEQGFATNGFGLWAVEVDGRFAGFTGLNRTSFNTPMGPHVEIGWRLAKWAWGHGYATEAAARVLRESETRLQFRLLASYSRHRRENIRKLMAALRDTQNYVQLAARGLTLWDVGPSRVERDLAQWEPLTQWLA